MPAVPVAPNQRTTTPNAGSGSGHQITKPPGQPVGSGGTSVVPVPIGAVLKGGITGTAYSETISAQGGTAPYTYTVTSGALPTGTSLNSSTGVISGTPSVAATSSFTITVTDVNGNIGSQSFSITIDAPVSGASNYGWVHKQ